MTHIVVSPPRGHLVRLPRRRKPRWTLRTTRDIARVPDHWCDYVPALAPLGVTENEVKVAWLVSWFKTSDQIAEAFGVSRSTVTNTISSLLRRFALSDRRQLLRKVRSLVEGREPPGGIL